MHALSHSVDSACFSGLFIETGYFQCYNWIIITNKVIKLPESNFIGMLEVKLLGQFEVLSGGRRLSIPSRNAQALFAYLALNKGKAYRREKLAGLLWPDSSEENARSNLRHELWRLRKALEVDGQTYFLIDDLTIAFNPRGEYSLDVQKLESIPQDSNAAEDLIETLSAYHGELLPGFYDEWVSAERSRLQALFEARISSLLEILQSQARWTEVLDWGMRWVKVVQWAEPAYRALMTGYANTGDMSKAVATYEALTLGLKKDLGVEPSEQTQELYQRLKAGWKADRPVKVPNLRSTSANATAKTAMPAPPLLRLRRSNLPKPLTSFIGREKEIRDVKRLVSRARLVTITGSGGVGKTRLAIEVAGALAGQFRDGARWVELAALFETPIASASNQAAYQEEPEDMVVQAVAKAMRVPDSPEQPLLQGIIEYGRARQMLLLLDNCEHLIEECAALAEDLLSNCPEVTILTTSREALGVPGEKAWRLPSLSLPGKMVPSANEMGMESEAMCLFIERAADVLPGYQPSQADLPKIAQICLRLDGIPLAIELAAARMKLLSPQEIAARLDNRFSLLTGGHRTDMPRHQTLRAAIEWSYDLLNETEQALFRRLSVFAGSFSLEAAEAVCSGQDIPRDQVLSILGRLVDKSLLQVEPPPQETEFSTRYRFLDTIQEFACIQLDELGELLSMRRRHADYYVHLVETAEPELNLQNQNHWYRLLQEEHDNLRAVVEWSAESQQVESALRLAGALLWFWFRSGSNREGLDLALKALASPSAIHYKHARARALNTAGFLLCLLGDTQASRQSLEEALSILRDSGDQANLAWTLQFLGLVLAYDEEYDQADVAFTEGLALSKNLLSTNVNSFLFFLGDVDLLKGDAGRAKKRYEESARILRDIGNKSFLAYPLRRLGYLALAQNDIPNARVCFLESLKLNNEVGDMPGLTNSMTSLAVLAIRLGNPVVAARLCGVVEKRLESLSVNLLYIDQAEYRQAVIQLLTSLDGDTFNTAFEEGWALGEQQAIEMAREAVGEDD